MTFHHLSVLLTECLEALQIRPDGIYVDGTLGGAGHSLAICEGLTTGRLIGIDQDGEAIAAAHERLAPFSDKVTLVRDNFVNSMDILQQLGITEVNGFLLDIGVSSHQLDMADRGFSYQQDAPLDMRMDDSNPLTANDIVNTYSAEELNNIIFRYGEERWAKRIAEFIVAERAIEPIDTTAQLVEVIKKAVPKGARRDGPHPAKRTFQALRIAVNDELGVLERAIGDMAGCLSDGGRIAIITFHSLEDRIVKEAFRSLQDPCTCPKEFPVCVCGKQPLGKIITRKPITPGEDELERNPRARSAKLRVFERRITE